MENDFLNIIENMLNTPDIQNLKSFKHHYGSTRLNHCISVSYYSYCICKFLHLDYKSVARAGLLHDLFLYDCESKTTRPKFHIYTHPKVALENSKKLFNLNKKECDIILKHMWPITFIPPKYLESYIVTFVDKFCAFKEWQTYAQNWLFIYFCTYKKLDFLI